ncbi:hypothetical protein LTR37_008115 [Vermiconidia calcicola]|uniref:Uncharacterized protein n=1 Tax=Vermiconidia calcicola TaxID=1690605 RepID=A0ACC3NEL4_9PEZI|nr:hypothetical protein LTR37_008115 [Vermiconidia calcicola]
MTVRQQAFTLAKEVYNTECAAQVKEEAVCFNALVTADSLQAPRPQTALTAAAEERLRNAAQLQRAADDQAASLSKLSSKFVKIRKDAQQALQDAGLMHFQQVVQSLKIRIADMEDEQAAKKKSKKAELESFYHDALLGLPRSSQSNLPEPQSTAPGIADATVEKAFGETQAKLILDYRAHDELLNSYTTKREAYIAARLDADGSEHEAALRAESDVQWLDGLWQRARELKTVEGRYLKRRNVAFERGLKVAPSPEYIEHALPPFAGDRPEDGEVDSMAPEALEIEVRQASEARPSIEDWRNAVLSVMPPLPDSQFTQRQFTESNDGSLRPWDSLSTSGQPPWRKERIKHRRDWERYD